MASIDTNNSLLSSNEIVFNIPDDEALKNNKILSEGYFVPIEKLNIKHNIKQNTKQK